VSVRASISDLRDALDSSRSLEDAIGCEDLQAEKPRKGYADYRQQLFEFSESLEDMGGLFGRQRDESEDGNDHRKRKALRIAGRKFKEGLKQNLKVDFIGAEIKGVGDLVVHVQALRNTKFETITLHRAPVYPEHTRDPVIDPALAL